MLVLRGRSAPLLLVILATMSGCIPYTVGHTAKPVRKNEVKVSTSLFLMNRQERYATGSGWNYLGIDVEGRAGVSDRADVGLRLASGDGVVGTYMRRLNGKTEDPGASISAMVGVGTINELNYGMAEGTLIASGDENGRYTPFGGVRVVKTWPFVAVGLQDRATTGVFFGMRIGSPNLGISPELGVFYDEPFEGVSRGNVLVVPAISIHGNYFGWLGRVLGRR